MKKVEELKRCCIVSRNTKLKKHMIRFVVDPNNNVVVDIKGNLPGRGMWVDCNKELITQAVEKNIFSKSVKKSVVAKQDLVNTCEVMLRKRIFEIISLARRSGMAINGFEKVKELLKSQKCALVICASDDSDGKNKISGMCRMFKLPFYTFLKKQELNKVFASENVTYAGIKKCGISDILNIEMIRLKMYFDGEC